MPWAPREDDPGGPGHARAVAASEAVLSAVGAADALLSPQQPDRPGRRVNEISVGVTAGYDSVLSPRCVRSRLSPPRRRGHSTVIGSLVEAWDLDGDRRVPSVVELAAARRAAGAGGMTLDLVRCTAQRLAAAAAFEPWGFVKGSALRVARDSLLAHGIPALAGSTQRPGLHPRARRAGRALAHPHRRPGGQPGRHLHPLARHRLGVHLHPVRPVRARGPDDRARSRSAHRHAGVGLGQPESSARTASGGRPLDRAVRARPGQRAGLGGPRAPGCGSAVARPEGRRDSAAWNEGLRPVLELPPRRHRSGSVPRLRLATAGGRWSPVRRPARRLGARPRGHAGQFPVEHFLDFVGPPFRRRHAVDKHQGRIHRQLLPRTRAADPHRLLRQMLLAG